MDHREAAEAYRRATIENAPPLKLVRMLYAGALRFLDQALVEDPDDPHSAFVDRVHRVDRIVSELRLALDRDHGRDVSAQLEQLYLYAEDGLAAAALQRSHEPLHSVRRVLVPLADAWNRIDLGESADS